MKIWKDMKDKKILVVGLGMIGASYAKKLKEHRIYVGGISARQSTIDYALENGVIDSGSIEVTSDYVGRFDIIISALYPKLFIEWVKNYQQLFKSGAILTDTTGIKCSVLYEIQSFLRKDVELIGAHPMAGREVSGIESMDTGIFEGANYLITPTDANTPEAVETARKIGEMLGFKSISVLSPEEHDEMIAFLSQLTHCIAVSLMCCKDSTHLVDYTGDSFRDLTRIANINEKMWPELFMMNRSELLEQMNLFEKEFSKLRKAVENRDVQTIREMLILSTSRRKQFNR
jgi:prephenate dehydrogenase